MVQSREKLSSIEKHPRMSDMDRKNWREIFNLESRIHEGHYEKRITMEAMQHMFMLVCYEPPAKLLREFKAHFDAAGGTLNFL